MKSLDTQKASNIKALTIKNEIEYSREHKEIKKNVVIYSKEIIDNWEEFASKVNQEKNIIESIGINCIVDEKIVKEIIDHDYFGYDIGYIETKKHWENTSLPIYKYENKIYEYTTRNMGWGGVSWGQPGDGYPVVDDVEEELIDIELDFGYKIKEAQVGDWFTWISDKKAYQEAIHEYDEKYNIDDEYNDYRIDSPTKKEYCLKHKKLRDYTWLFTKVSDDKWKALGLANSNMFIRQNI